MSISTIPYPEFVFCTDCRYRRPVKDLRRKHLRYKCELHATMLYSLNSGCGDGIRRRR